MAAEYINQYVHEHMKSSDDLLNGHIIRVYATISKEPAKIAAFIGETSEYSISSSEVGSVIAMYRKLLKNNHKVKGLEKSIKFFGEKFFCRVGDSSHAAASSNIGEIDTLMSDKLVLTGKLRACKIELADVKAELVKSQQTHSDNANLLIKQKMAVTRENSKLKRQVAILTKKLEACRKLKQTHTRQKNRLALKKRDADATIKVLKKQNNSILSRVKP